jgi:CHAT domain-containing protein
MLEFMSLIKKEIPPAEALRRAMLETRKIYSEPELWAAFNVFGRGTRCPQCERP